MKRFASIIIVIISCASGPVAAEYVVLSSTQSSVAVGSVIGDTQKVSLAANKTLLLIDKAGRTITLNGPHEGVIEGGSGGKSDNKLVKALSSLIRDNEDDARSVGAIRAADRKRIEDTVTSKQAAMVINISETGDYCRFSGTSSEMVRYHSETGNDVTLTAIANGESQVVSWQRNESKVEWPAALPVENGARFLVSQQGKDTWTLITVHDIAEEAPTEAHLAVSLIAKDCVEQARLMLVYIRRSAK